ncbi:MAG: DUF896 domain-containing protein [Clostridiales bacterium]|nr:DUF896 domain-containing protein [Clostridiales bacterium]
MDAESIARINALAKKKREEGLTPEETAEQQRLRAQYLEEFRRGMEQTLQNVRIKEPDGTLTPLVKKADKK